VVDTLKNLGIGEGVPLIGSPFPWPHAKMPNELFESMAGMIFLKSNGASFSGTLYPKLALAYPGLKLADLRGEFIRGWDDGRGVDTGRAILSSQADSLQNHGHRTIRLRFIGIGGGNMAISDGSSEFTGDNDLIGDVSPRNFSGGAPRVAGETRPRSVAFNYIVRAA
jgi:hypothetical protein